MEEEKITLTLDEAPAAPKLVLDPEEEKAVAQPKVEEAVLTPEENRMVDEFSQKIDITNTNMVLQYGAGAQKKIAGFSETALQQVRSKDLGEIGDTLSNLVVELKGFDIDEEEKNGFFGMFKKAGNRITAMKARYDSAAVNVDKICNVLEGHQVQLMKDVAMLDKMYAMNLTYFKELSMYIIAGKRRLESFRNNELKEAQDKAVKSGLPEDAQYANDLASLCTSFEKKLHDLELTRMVSIQMGPQIRMVQNNDSMMAEKIQSTMVNTIPLWKSQMVLALGLEHSQQAMEAQRAATDMTNELLRKNAEKLKMGTIATAKETERGIVDIETLRNTNAALISTLDEVMRIQAEGREKRRAAEIELGKMEGELKQKLLEIRN